MRIAHVGPVATSIPPPKSGSVETMTSLLTEGLVARGHDVTLFATGDSTTSAKLHATFPRGYWRGRQPSGRGSCARCSTSRRRSSGPRSSTSSTTRRCTTRCRWRSRGCRRRRSCRRCITRRARPKSRSGRRYPEAPFVAISQEQARAARRAQRRRHRAARASTPTASRSARRRTTTCCSSAASPRARACCRRSRWRAASACACCSRPPRTTTIATRRAARRRPQIVYVGEADHATKVRLLGGARALLYPVQAARAVRAGAGRGDGLRHAGRRARPRRRRRARRSRA